MASRAWLIFNKEYIDEGESSDLRKEGELMSKKARSTDPIGEAKELLRQATCLLGRPQPDSVQAQDLHGHLNEAIDRFNDRKPRVDQRFLALLKAARLRLKHIFSA
jgi:hypothetical protein